MSFLQIQTTPIILLFAVMYFSCEEQGTKSEDCWHLDDGEQELVGFRDTLSLDRDVAPASAVIVLPFKDGHQGSGN